MEHHGAYKTGILRAPHFLTHNRDGKGCMSKQPRNMKIVPDLLPMLAPTVVQALF